MVKQKWIVNLAATGLALGTLLAATAAPAAEPSSVNAQARAALREIGVARGLCAVLGLPQEDQPGFVTALARASRLLVYFQSPGAEEVGQVRQSAEAAGLLGTRVFADQGDWRSIHLADNLVDAVWVAPPATGRVREKELLRVLHPEAIAIVGGKRLVKPAPEGTDEWTHPYHAPDNNPLSTDQLARAPYLTQFLAEPMFCPMPEVSVASGGRVFRAFGHIAHKANQNPMLNTLLCINGYNGTVLWRRALREGFMIHRNAMVATPEILYLADDQSCKLIDARTGKLKDEIVVPEGAADGPVWKWMALEDGVLYALVGGREIRPKTCPSDVPGLGHWPWGMWEGHDYKDPKTNFGFGRNFLAIDLASKKVLWNHRRLEYVDSRGVCMSAGRIYFYSPGKSLGCLDARTGEIRWKTSSAEVLEAIGPNLPAQHYVTGYSTTTYVKCTDKFVFFAGPQRQRLVAVSAEDGRLLWQKEHGNLQLVLREDALYGAGPGATGCKLACATGEQLGELPTRRACTRATGSVDSIFYRTTGGTVRVDLASNTAQHIAPMRPPCHDGVIISRGLLYFGPWMCGCQLSLYGHIALAPAGDFDFHPEPGAARFQRGPDDPTAVAPLELRPGDWPCYRGNSRRTSATRVPVPHKIRPAWTFRPARADMPTAPVAAGGMVFVGDRHGVLRALDARGGLRWKVCTGGAIYYPPAVADGRVYAGSADGWVYALEAATGRLLWRFRLAPTEQRIPVYGKLISRWPVSGGVVVDQGVVYAAAGIAHYDGTYVVALDAVTGEVKWYNDTSGSLSEVVDSGISLQGNLYLRGEELCFLGGGKYQTARYDRRTGKCLNPPDHTVVSRFQTAFYPYFPEYAKYPSLVHTFADGRTLSCQASYEGSRHSKLSLLAPAAPQASRPRTPTRLVAARRPGEPQRKVLWEDPAGRWFFAFVVTPDALVAAGQTGSFEASDSFLVAVDVNDGSDIWRRELPAPVVKDGIAVDHSGRIIVSLEDGHIRCFR